MKKIYCLLMLFVFFAAGCKTDNSEDAEYITDKFDPAFALELQKRGYIIRSDQIMASDVAYITELDIAGTQNVNNTGSLTSIRGIEYFTSLKILNCSYNKLMSLDVSKNESMEVLKCNENLLKDLNISNNSALKELDCGYNLLETLDISLNTKLTNLTCSGNILTSLELSNNNDLIELNCQHNMLHTIDVSNIKSLTSLYCLDNKLTQLDVSHNTNLTHLMCSDNLLSSIDIQNNRTLKNFTCKNNPGDGTTFHVTAWFDNNTIPSGFTSTGWKYDNRPISISYKK